MPLFNFFLLSNFTGVDGIIGIDLPWFHCYIKLLDTAIFLVVIGQQVEIN